MARYDHSFGRLENLLNVAAGLSIFGIMVLGVLQIAARGISGALHQIWPSIQPFAIHGYIDWIEFIAVLYAVLGVAYCQRVGGHIRMDVVIGLLRGRALWIAEAFAVLLALAITLVLVEATFENFWRAFTKGDSSMDIRLPQWPSKLIVPLALATLALRLALQLWGYARLVADPSRAPLAVPVILTTEEIAQAEIEEALGREAAAGGPAPRKG